MFLLERQTRIDVLRPFGWAGDRLIWAGARNIFERHGVAFRSYAGHKEIHAVRDRAEILYVYGSGGFCEEYHSMPDQLAPLFSEYRQVVILPSSFDPSYEPVAWFIMELPEHVIVYCREPYSYRAVRDCSRHPENVYLEEDTAFAFDYAQWATRKPGMGVLEEFHSSDKIHLRFPDVKTLMEKVNAASEVHTDRTHLAIAAAMLGRKVVLYEHNYHKWLGIYEFSLSRFRNVEFRQP